MSDLFSIGAELIFSGFKFIYVIGDASESGFHDVEEPVERIVFFKKMVYFFSKGSILIKRDDALE